MLYTFNVRQHGTSCMQFETHVAHHGGTCCQLGRETSNPMSSTTGDRM